MPGMSMVRFEAVSDIPRDDLRMAPSVSVYTIITGQHVVSARLSTSKLSDLDSLTGPALEHNDGNLFLYALFYALPGVITLKLIRTSPRGFKASSLYGILG